MASTTYSGAVYGVGVYGTSVYGVSNVTHVPDGVVASVTSNSGVIIIGDAVHVVVGISSTAVHGSVGVVAVGTVVPDGVEITTNVGEVTTRSVNYILASGVDATSFVGDIVVNAGATTGVITTSTVESFNGFVDISAGAVLLPSGVSATFSVDSVDVVGFANVSLAGVEATFTIDDVSVTTTSFNYVASNYDRRLTVYVDAYPNRTVYIDDYPSRVVYVEPKPTENNRRMLVAETWS